MTKIIGLTGGIGSGKTTVINYIASKNIPVYIADEAGKYIMEKPEVIKQVNTLFNNEVLLHNGLLDRKKIAEIVFNNKEKLEVLNGIVHPAVAKDFEDFVKQNQNSNLIVKESAILFESGAYKVCDASILVTAPEQIRIERVVKRDHVAEEEVLKRMRNQMSDEEKAKLSDFVITNIDLQETYNQIDKVLEEILT